MSWETVIGLEVHVQLSTVSKLFSGASTAFGAEPNTQACAVDLGLPGVLPVLNGNALRMAIRFGLAVDAEIAPVAEFARKNYFYPDLPKGYQISQLDRPIVGCGHIDIVGDDGNEKRIGITRAHLEEDAGKSVHDAFTHMSGIDLNRAGTPLIEIVSEPDMASAREAVAYLRKVHAIVRYLDICDGNLQEGSFRCDANVSVRRPGAPLGTRTELKNLNSFRFIERAINYEIERQIDLLESGSSVVQQTRLYDPDRHETRPLRDKEEAHDYRYFPDPDLLPVVVPQALVDELRDTLPELPDARRTRFEQVHGLSQEDAAQLTAAVSTADYFEAAEKVSGNPKMTANWVNVELTGALNKSGLDVTESPVSATRLGQLVARISDDTISGKIAKQLFELMWTDERDVDAIIDAQGLRQVTDSSAIEAFVAEVLEHHPAQVEDFRNGNAKILGFLVGQVMKTSGGKANPKQVNALLRQHIEEHNS
ncbi:MAG: Asp-tRNA(Asn)/Glu-tRNA(Gln) amidotransferase subunit GatB [Pseudomonadota bacterium]